MQSLLEEWAQARRYRAGWYGTAAVNRALGRIAELRDAGAFDDAFYKRSLSWFEGHGTGLEPGEESIVLVAVPRPAHVVTFDYRGGSHDLVLPPTYHNYNGLFNEVREDLEAFSGGRVPLRVVKAPLKTLATGTGFARYGKNNVTYLDGLGSYLQLVAFASRIPVGKPAVDETLEPAALERCGRCRACHEACPVGAIGPDRFLIHAERCVTWFSEYEGPLPEAFGAARRPCLVGCMVCQEVCPANKGRLHLERLAVHFAHEETEYLLGERPGAAQPAQLQAKVKELRCSDCSLSAGGPNPTFRRNLGAVLGHLSM